MTSCVQVTPAMDVTRNTCIAHHSSNAGQEGLGPRQHLVAALPSAVPQGSAPHQPLVPAPASAPLGLGQQQGSDLLLGLAPPLVAASLPPRRLASAGKQCEV